jgi:hypothetical protein
MYGGGEDKPRLIYPLYTRCSQVEDKPRPSHTRRVFLIIADGGWNISSSGNSKIRGRRFVKPDLFQPPPFYVRIG